MHDAAVSDARTSPTRRELLWAALALAACVTVLLWEPLTHWRERTFTTADLLQRYPYFRIEPDHVPRNALLCDPVLEFLPWIEFARGELEQGRFPAWNPLNGCGVPFWANGQCAVLAPSTLWHCLFDTKPALLASAFFESWWIGLFTFLFLRRLALHAWAALGGAIVFLSCGHNSLLLAYPHTGVIAFLPSALYCAESLVQTFERRGPRRARRWTLALLATVLAMAYGGHPESLFFASATLAAFVASRLAALGWAEWRGRSASSIAVPLAVRFAFVASVALACAAPMLVPTLDYVLRSTRAQAIAASGHEALDSTTWPRYAFPDVLGRPIDGALFAPREPPPNYETANLAYVGALAMLLAALGLRRGVARAATLPFAVIAVVWLPWAHDLGGFARVLGLIPGVAWIPHYVGQAPWALAIAVLSAAALDRVLSSEHVASRARAAVFLALSGAATAITFRGALELVAQRAVRHSVPAELVAAARAHVGTLGSALVVGCFAIGLALAANRLAARRLGVALALAVLFVQGPLTQSRYHVACEDRFVAPRTAALDTLAREVGDARVLILSPVGVPPHVNMRYGLHLVTTYDALGVFEYERLLHAVLDPSRAWQATLTADARALELLGVEFVAIDSPGASAPPRTPSGTPRAHWMGTPDELEEAAQLDSAVLYRLKSTRGRAWLVPNGFVQHDAEGALRYAAAAAFDPYTAVVLGPDLPVDFAARAAWAHPPGPRTREQLALERAAVLGSVDSELEHPGFLRLRVRQSSAQYLVLATTRDAGWSATLDGHPAPLLQANSAFMALDVPEGEHLVELTYRPRGWSVALVSAALGLASALAWCIRREPTAARAAHR